MGERIVFDPSVYYKYDEIVQLLRQWAEEYPNLTNLYSIGKTYEGRDMWLIEITNKETGCADNKPGYYVDGNFHAGEVTGSAVCLYTINHLLTQYGKDDEVTRLVDETSFYILPRVSCDGSELYLTTPTMLRSSTRPYPFEDEQPGLHMKDINGDGFITQMRIEDPNGDWKVSDKDPRLMVRRQPDDVEGRFYRVYLEGEIKDYDGFEVKMAPSKYGLDINRNSAANWQPEHKQRGAGPYPFSEPETRNIAEFLLKHKNIAGIQSYHTTGGIHLRPCCTKPDSQMPPMDVRAYKEIGERGKEYTGYPHVNTYEGYVGGKGPGLSGVFMDWTYEHLGITTFSTELWDLLGRAGVERKDFASFRKRTAKQIEEDALKILKWNDEVLNGEGFIDWQPFDHPQLGKVEIGGWKTKFVRQNPPPQFLPEECEKNMRFTMVHMKALPKLAIAEAKAEKVGEGFYKITVVVENRGYLPTSGSQMAQKLKTVSPVKVSLCVPDEAEIAFGAQETELGHMAGWSKKKAEWLVRANSGSEITVKAVSDRAGKKSTTIVLD